MFRRILMILLWLVLLGGGFVFYWIQDANRFKPELEKLIEQQAGVPVKINGDLAWRLLPPLSLTAASVTAVRDGQRWSAQHLALDLDVMTILRTRDVNQWRVQALTLRDATMADRAGKLDLAKLTVRDFAAGKPAPLNTTLTYTPADGNPVPLTLNALVTYSPDPQRISIHDATFSTSAGTAAAAGTCDVDATPARGGAPAPAPRDADLIPVEAWRDYDWEGRCDLDQLTLDGQRFDDVTLTLSNHAAKGENELVIPKFFGGAARLNLAIDAHADPVRWTLTPDLENVDSRQLMAWIDERFHWIAPLAYGGTLTFEGNSPDELIASLSGETRFDGGQGAISITRIKEPLLKLATMLQEPEQVSSWPDVWDYQRFVGSWRVDKQHHNLDVALDNLTVVADGSYDPVRNQMDMLAELTFKTQSEGPMFQIDPLLMDLPIPVRCRGALEDPQCKVDEKAAQRLVASVLTSQEGSATREKLEAKIDEKVPEEYREAARSLLDLLGGALESNARESGQD